MDSFAITYADDTMSSITSKQNAHPNQKTGNLNMCHFYEKMYNLFRLNFFYKWVNAEWI